MNQGDVRLENVTVEGKTIIRGGGKDSIQFIDFTCGEVRVIKTGGKIRIVAIGDTKEEKVLLESGAHIEGNGIKTITVLKADEEVLLDGDFENAAIEGDVKVIVSKDTKIATLQIKAEANINLDKGAKVMDLTIDAPVTITSEGTIEKAKINIGGAKLETEPKKHDIAEGKTVEIGGK